MMLPSSSVVCNTTSAVNPNTGRVVRPALHRLGVGVAGLRLWAGAVAVDGFEMEAALGQCPVGRFRDFETETLCFVHYPRGGVQEQHWRSRDRVLRGCT